MRRWRKMGKKEEAGEFQEKPARLLTRFLIRVINEGCLGQETNTLRRKGYENIIFNHCGRGYDITSACWRIGKPE